MSGEEGLCLLLFEFSVVTLLLVLTVNFCIIVIVINIVMKASTTIKVLFDKILIIANKPLF